MISIYKNNELKTVENGEVKEALEIRGLASEKDALLSDESVGNGTVYIEIDTGKVYMLDKENQEWKEL